MKVLDPGHEYELDTLDGDIIQRLLFVKREGEKYPGNVGHHPGTTTQEVLRACVNRLNYVNEQMYSAETQAARQLLETVILLLEMRAARMHGRHLVASLGAVVAGIGKCQQCGHVGCEGHKEKD